jgi:hypothetical protein
MPAIAKAATCASPAVRKIRCTRSGRTTRVPGSCCRRWPAADTSGGSAVTARGAPGGGPGGVPAGPAPRHPAEADRWRDDHRRCDGCRWAAGNCGGHRTTAGVQHSGPVGLTRLEFVGQLHFRVLRWLISRQLDYDAATTAAVVFAPTRRLAWVGPRPSSAPRALFGGSLGGSLRFPRSSLPGSGFSSPGTARPGCRSRSDCAAGAGVLTISGRCRCPGLGPDEWHRPPSRWRVGRPSSRSQVLGRRT